jgi:hypothetical protein
VLQLVITVGGTALGTLGSFWSAQRAYEAAKADLQSQRKELQVRQKQLETDRLQLRLDMTNLGGEMAKLIQQCDLKVTVPAPPAMDQTQPVQPQQPFPEARPAQQIAPRTTDECWDQYREKNEHYSEYQRQWNDINQQLSSLATRQQELVEQLRQLPWPSGRIPEACLQSLTQSSLMAAGTPLVVGYVIWVLGLPLICFGCFWLALVRRLFLAPPHCYLEPF